MTTRSKALLSVLVLTVLAGVFGVGTFATFSAETDNATTFRSGTIVLSDTVNTGTACLSTDVGTTAGTNTDTNVNTCDAFFDLDTQKPGGTAQTANLTLQNKGSLDAAAAQVFTSGCTATDASTQNYHGSGDICTVVDFYIQEWTDNTFSTPVACIYGHTTTANVCDFDAAVHTLSDFATNHANSTNGAALGALNAGASRYYTIGVQLDSTADNTMQGRQADMTLQWLASQS